METRRIGSLEVTVVGLGCNNFGGRLDEAGSAAVVHAALDAGINFFDTADVYGATKGEEFLGRALGNRRRDAIIATKFGNEVDEQRKGARPEYVKQAAEDSLRRLGTDTIDLYQLHKPDPTVPIADTLGAMDDLVKAGKVREIACSNFSTDQLREAEAAVRPGTARFESVQNEYHLFAGNAERDVLAECARLGIGYIPYFPLAAGLLTGKYRQGQPFPDSARRQGKWLSGMLNDDRKLAQVEALVKFAESKGHTLLELAMSWLASQPPVATVIAGAMTSDQVTANARSADWRLTDTDFAEVDAILTQ